MKLSLLSIAAFMSFGRSVVANGSVAGCAIDQTLLVGIGFGYDAHDNFWELRDICTNTVIDSTTAGTYTSNQRVDLNWCLDNTSRFRFTIFDNGENGILVRRGEGPTFPGLTLNWANNVLTEVGGSFWQYNNFPMRSDLYSQQYEFGATSCPTAPPAITETPPTGPEPNPCEPSPCEENTFCHPQPDGTAYCVCKEHFIGDPLQGCTGGPPTPTPPTPTPSNPGAGGDPHFKTWTGYRFDYHGVCELVLLRVPQFAHGTGLTIHIRTKSRYHYSYIESAAVRIGDDTLEVSSFGGYMLDAVSEAAMPAVVGGQFLVSHDQKSDKEHVFEIVITEDTTIKLKTFKDMVSVSVDAKSMDAFEGSIGLLGSHGGQMLARDGVTVLQNDPDAYGQEWQVREEEAGLFMDMDYSPQYPQQCVVPQKDPTSSSRRLGEQSITETQAGDACAVAGRLDDMKECIFDVVATQDLSMADAGAF